MEESDGSVDAGNIFLESGDELLGELLFRVCADGGEPVFAELSESFVAARSADDLFDLFNEGLLVHEQHPFSFVDIAYCNYRRNGAELQAVIDKVRKIYVV